MKAFKCFSLLVSVVVNPLPETVREYRESSARTLVGVSLSSISPPDCPTLFTSPLSCLCIAWLHCICIALFLHACMRMYTRASFRDVVLAHSHHLCHFSITGIILCLLSFVFCLLSFDLFLLYHSRTQVTRHCHRHS